MTESMKEETNKQGENLQKVEDTMLEVKKDAELADDNIAVAEKITIADGKKLMLLLLFIFIVIVFIVVVVVVTLWD